MRRHLLNLLTALSLLLCVATVVLWSAAGPETRQASATVGRHTRYRATTHDGAVEFRRSAFSWEASRGSEIVYGAGMTDKWHWPRRRAMGFVVYGYTEHFAERSGAPHSMDVTVVFLPYWLLAAVTAAPPAWWAWGSIARRARARRARVGLCRTCGYDLRATPDRCPECGTVATTPA